MGEIDLITQKEFAKIVDVDPSYISRLAKQGVFDKCKSGKKLIKDCALRAYFLREAKKSDKNFKPFPTQQKELDELLAQTNSPAQYVQVLRDYWSAQTNKFKLDVEKGKYYPKEEIDKKAERIITAAKSKALAIPTKIAPHLLAMNDVNEIKEVLERAMQEFLDELARLDDELV